MRQRTAITSPFAALSACGIDPRLVGRTIALRHTETDETVDVVCLRAWRWRGAPRTFGAVTVQFGHVSRVVVRFADGREETFSIRDIAACQWRIVEVKP